MSYSVHVQVNHAACVALLTRRAELIGQRVQRVARRRANKKTGQMAASVSVSTGIGPGTVHADIGTPLARGMWTHEGTGIYNGGGLIYPRRARAFKFTPHKVGPVRGSGKFGRGAGKGGAVYTAYIKGMPGSPWLVSSLEDVVGSTGRVRRTARRRRG